MLLSDFRNAALNGELTLDGLLSKEVMRHDLNLRAEIRRFCEDWRQILQHESSRRARPLAPQLLQVVAFAAAHVDQKDLVAAASHALDQPFQRVEVGVHPAGAALVVHRHEIIELRIDYGVVLDEFEERGFQTSTQLEGAVQPVFGIAIVRLLEELGNGQDWPRRRRGAGNCCVRKNKPSLIESEN